jgi:hypothetical protein
MNECMNVWPAQKFYFCFSDVEVVDHKYFLDFFQPETQIHGLPMWQLILFLFYFYIIFSRIAFNLSLTKSA